jgi:DNA-binding protein HU-beta
MNKSELISAIASSAGLTNVDAKKALDSITGAVSGSLKKGDNVALIGFGTFSVNNKPARTGRNPQTGKEIKIAAKKVPTFKAGVGLKGSVN